MLYGICEQRRWGFVTRGGEVRVAPAYLEAHGDGAARIAVKDAKRKWGFLDGASGAVAIAPAYTWICPFAEGLAAVQRGARWSFIDAAGATVIERAPGRGSFGGGFAAVTRDDGTLAWIDRAGVERFTHVQPYGAAFAEGVAPARAPGGALFGLIDTDGRWTAAPAWESIESMSEGLALAAREDRVRFIDRAGAVVFDTDWTPVGPMHGFRDGRALVHRGGRYGYLDRAGALAIPDRFGAAWEFSDGLAVAGPRSTEQGIIDRDGAWVVEPKYYEVSLLPGRVARVYPTAARPQTFALLDIDAGRWIWKPPALAKLLR